MHLEHSSRRKALALETVSKYSPDLLLISLQPLIKSIPSSAFGFCWTSWNKKHACRWALINCKTGYRVANTMPAAVSVYERICARYPAHKSKDFIFLPAYENRTTASKIIQRQFNELLQRESLEIDTQTGKKHMLYSLRHTAICMRIINSEGVLAP